jgi:hypothetical protein
MLDAMLDEWVDNIEDLLLMMEDWEGMSGGSRRDRKSLTRRSCFNPPVGGADIAFTGGDDLAVKETWFAEKHSGGECSPGKSVRMRNTSRSSDAGSTICNGCDVLRNDCVAAG